METPTFVPSFHESGPASDLDYRQLGRTDMYVPRVGVGGCSFGDIWVEKDSTDPKETIIFALKRGLNYIDTAPWYGNRKSERTIGNALRDVPRSAYYLATKIGRYQPDPVEKIFDFSYGATMRSIEKSLELLNTPVIDLCQIHDPEFAPSANEILDGAMRALEHARAAGKIRYIGVTGYSFDRQRELLAGAKDIGIDVVTSLTYARIALHDSAGLGWLREISDPDTAVGGAVAGINASCMGMGMHTPQGPPRWFDFTPTGLLETAADVRARCRTAELDICRLAISRAVAMSRSVTVPSFTRAAAAATAAPASAAGAADADGEQMVCPMTLMSCMTPSLIEANIINSADGALSCAETAAAEAIESDYRALPIAHWEGREPRKHWLKLAKHLTSLADGAVE